MAGVAVSFPGLPDSRLPPFTTLRVVPVDNADEARRHRTLARAYAQRMRQVEFFSHLTAAAMWGAPVNLPAGSPIDVSVYGNAGLPRCRGVRGHRADPRRTTTSECEGLRAALDLIWEDSWSPMESLCRVILDTAGLPEPARNVDVYGRDGGFLACVDLAFPAFKVAVEYQGQLHGARYAQDIERIEALRRDGWIVIQVTSALIGRRELLVARVRGALESRGWHH
jgi:hypothetical protein